MSQIFLGNANSVPPFPPFTDTGQTVNLQTINLATFPLSAVGTYFFTAKIAAYEATGPNAAGISLYTTFLSDGVTATIVGDSDPIVHLSAPFDLPGSTIDYQMVGSGVNAILQVTGIAGYTIDWGSLISYVYRG